MPPPIAQLRAAKLSLGLRPLFQGVDLSISKGERAALIGRNGAGKSTLMKVVVGQIDIDSGERWADPKITTGYLAQDPDLSGFETLRDYACADLPSADSDRSFRAEAELSALGLDPNRSTQGLSGGETRRAALARLFASDPDLLLLDEPTNHLDIAAIEDLETRLNAFRGGVLIVSHDRKFLENTSNTIFWLRQGKVFTLNRGYGHFEDWAAQVEAEEEKALAKLELRLAQEEHWLQRGVTARRSRNEGRRHRLLALRQERRQKLSMKRERQQGAVLAVDDEQISGKLIFDAERVYKSFQTTQGEKPIVRDFSIKVQRGDRLGIVGPNGAGKSTLIDLLLGNQSPESGRIRRGAKIELAYLDQRRSTLKPDVDIWDTLCPLGGDQVMVRGRPRHVAAYARDFLFGHEQLRQPVGSLSGGERNRLTLALALARPSNLLILDEPTNDLDMDTLDLLEDMLAAYDGTLILVSHDRSFLEGVVTSILWPDGLGHWRETPGGWDDYLRERAAILAQTRPRSSDVSAPAAPTSGTPSVLQNLARSKLSYKEERRLVELDALLTRLPKDIAGLESRLADPGLYARDPKSFETASKSLDQARRLLDALETEWLELEEKRAALSASSG
ncbi:MAG TPA: elongation factor 3 [Hyphomonadaceae bacterium]|nr:elongation factor 3 [Hyphomonadaceae bacterium]